MERVESDDIRVRTRRTSPDRRTDYDASVVVVTHRPDRAELTQTLDGLAGQTASSFEVVLVDNGTEWDLASLQSRYDVVTAYVAFEENYGVNVGRNVGADLAAGDLLVFLDDDGLPERDYVEQHCRAHRTRDIVAARGRVFTKTSGIYSWMGPRYDLGPDPFPYPIDLEGNTSVDRTAFAAVDGFDEGIWGHEAMHLSAKLLDRHEDDALLYYPDAVVYHDFVDGFGDLVKKKARHKYYRRELRRRRPELFRIYQRYDVALERSEQPPFATKLALYGITQLSDVCASLLHRLSSYDRPTR